ncbi:hypothetical protein IQ259_12440 [Fortiea sp. LEGE XX443]|uniref:hypothetical protein n=1 Tax=Fortiea sp. LEGE XX443 TaxID=1828611 RepID=UPI001882ABFF|nr:hypothetical protein [Fortiea sp. LEGE XX443]MBE9005835.1 hypothetical protein [Fortiea sp. LEGE XX443]
MSFLVLVDRDLPRYKLIHVLKKQDLGKNHQFIVDAQAACRRLPQKRRGASALHGFPAL